MKAKGRRAQARASSRRVANTRRELAEKARRDQRHRDKIKNEDTNGQVEEGKETRRRRPSVYGDG